MSWLIPEEVEKLYAAAIEAGLNSKRDALLAGVDRRFAAGLTQASDGAAQLRLDLAALNRVEHLEDGTIPLELWLANAAALCGGRVEGRIFLQQLENVRRISRIPERDGRPALPSPAHPLRRAVLTAAVLSSLAGTIAILRPGCAREREAPKKAPIRAQPPPGQTVASVARAAAIPRERAVFDPSAASSVKLRQIELVTSATSFRKTRRNGISAYLVDEALWRELNTRGCLADDRLPALLPRMRDALSAYAAARGLASIQQYLQTDAQIMTLARDHPEVAATLMPLPGEMLALSPERYEAHVSWLSLCVGIPYPVFLVTAENISSEEQVVTSIIYRNTSDLQDRSTGNYGPLSPRATYLHELTWMVGDQEAPLVPPFRLGPKTSGSFELELSTRSGDGLHWKLTIILVTARGELAAGDELWLDLSRPPAAPD